MDQLPAENHRDKRGGNRYADILRDVLHQPVGGSVPQLRSKGDLSGCMGQFPVQGVKQPLQVFPHALVQGGVYRLDDELEKFVPEFADCLTPGNAPNNYISRICLR